MNSDIEDILSKLPSVLAIPIQEYLNEKHKGARLLRLCDAVEMITRFALLVAIGMTLRDAEENDRFKEKFKKLRKKIRLNIERPTFGDLKQMLLTVASKKNLSRSTHPIADNLLKLVKALVPVLEGKKDTGWEGVIAVRNLLVHGGGMHSKNAEEYLLAWEPRIAKLINWLVFFEEYQLCFVRLGKLCQIQGVTTGADQIESFLGLKREIIQALEDHVLLIGAHDYLNLWPLVHYGKAEMKWLGTEKIAQAESPLIYSRIERGREKLLFAALGGDIPYSEQVKNDLYDGFLELFGITDVKPSQYEPHEEFRKNAEAMIGREAELRKIKDEISRAFETTRPDVEYKAVNMGKFPDVLWIGGPPGIGKSFLMAKLVESYRNDEKPFLCIAWRFKAQDAFDSHPEQFYGYAIRCLGRMESIGKPMIKPGKDSDERIQQLEFLLNRVNELGPSEHSKLSCRVIFFLDGMDEAAQLDPNFVQQPLRFRRNNVLWVCAGRTGPQYGTDLLYSSDHCTHVFDKETGLPKMTRNDIRSLLMSRMGDKSPLVVNCDEDSEEGVKNEAIEAIIELGEGLPLYVDLVARDLSGGYINIHDIKNKSRLPKGLNDYINELFNRQGVGKIFILKTQIMVVLSLSYAPLTKSTLHEVLIERMALEADEDAFLEDALQWLTGMVKLVRIGKGMAGYEIYHFSYAEFISKDQYGKFGSEINFARKSFNKIVMRWQTLPKGGPYEYALLFGARHLIDSADFGGLKNLIKLTNYLQEKIKTLGPHALFDDLDRLPVPEILSFSSKEMGQILKKLLSLLKRKYKKDPRQAAHWINALGWISKRQNVTDLEAFKLSAEYYLKVAEGQGVAKHKMKARMVRNAAWNFMQAEDYLKAADTFIKATECLKNAPQSPDIILREVEHRVREIYSLIEYIKQNGKTNDRETVLLRIEGIYSCLLEFKKSIRQKSSKYIEVLAEEIQAINKTSDVTERCSNTFRISECNDSRNPKVIIVSNQFDLWVADMLMDYFQRHDKSHLLLSPEKYGAENKWVDVPEVYIFGGPKAPAIGKKVSELFGAQRDFEKLYIQIDREEGFGKVFEKKGNGTVFKLIAGNDEETLDATLTEMRKLEPEHPVFYQDQIN